MNRQECQQCTADRKSELHLEAVKLNWSSFSPLFKWLYPQQVQKGTSEEKTNTTKKKYDCVHTDSDCCRVSYRPSNLLRSYGVWAQRQRMAESQVAHPLKQSDVGVKAILLFHTLLFCTNTIPPASHFSTFLILLPYPSLTLSFYRYSSVSRCDVHEVDKECRTYSGGPFSLSRACRVLLGLICLYRNYSTVSPGTTRHERKPYKGTASGVTQNPRLSVTALLIPQ